MGDTKEEHEMGNTKGHERNEMSDTQSLDQIDLATMTEDKVCIQRDHTTGQLSWRFATPQADPLGMMVRAMWYQMMHEGGYEARIEALEAKVKELEAGLGG